MTWRYCFRLYITKYYQQNQDAYFKTMIIPGKCSSFWAMILQFHEPEKILHLWCEVTALWSVADRRANIGKPKQGKRKLFKPQLSLANQIFLFHGIGKINPFLWFSKFMEKQRLKIYRNVPPRVWQAKHISNKLCFNVSRTIWILELLNIHIYIL